jgi:hypothetical protein
MRQRLLMFIKPNPIAHVDIAAAKRATFEMFGLTQWRSAGLPADDCAAWARFIHWHDRGHLRLSNDAAPAAVSTQLSRPITEPAALDCVVVVTTRCGRLNQISEEIMYKFAIAILLLSAPAFAQDKSEYQPKMPPNNMQKTVIPKSGGEQTPATTPTTAAEANKPDATATRPSKTGPEQTSIPNASPPATTTQTTGATNQEPKVKEMNEEEKKKIEKEGK